MAQITLSIELMSGNTVRFNTRTSVQSDTAVWKRARKFKDKMIAEIESDSHMPVTKRWEIEIQN